jgi:6-phosphofructokinase 1
VAEGAGQELFNDSIKETDPSGNILFKDIGLLLKKHIENYFKERSLDVRLKYIDPSYMIRGVPANPRDSIYCVHLAQNAVHAAMAGKTGVAMGCWHGHYVHVPIGLAVAGRKQVDPKGDLWHSLIESTGQSPKFFSKKLMSRHADSSIPPKCEIFALDRFENLLEWPCSIIPKNIQFPNP